MGEDVALHRGRKVRSILCEIPSSIRSYAKFTFNLADSVQPGDGELGDMAVNNLGGTFRV